MENKVASENMERYFSDIDSNVKKCYEIATKARKKGFDPETEVDVKLARNMAERVEGLISVVAPQLIGSNMTKRIVELEENFSPLDWRVALKIAVEVAEEKFCKFESKKEAMEVGIRVGFAYHTSGIVAAPLEGFVELKIKERRDGKEYFAASYAGPIRGAGGTAASFSLLLTDYVRKEMGYARWDPTEEEIGRIRTEIHDYHERVTNLQYHPSDDELNFLLRNLPIEISGDPTEKRDVSNYKDIERIGTNRIRGGVCLVLAEGLSQKAPKLWKRLESWGEDFGLKDWNFLKEFLDVKKRVLSKKDVSEKKNNEREVIPNYSYIKDLVAGRPVLGFPLKAGGFRLRYGRTRCSGFSAGSIHPALMLLLDNFIATGTQLKLERPGKSTSVMPCDTIECPIVKLKNGKVLRVDSVELANSIKEDVEEILYLGDILFNYGDFSENGQTLVPVGYNEEWWARELELSLIRKYKKVDIEKFAKAFSFDEDYAEEIFRQPNNVKISFDVAKEISEKFEVPLFPKFLFFWTQIKNRDVENLLSLTKDLNIDEDSGKSMRIVLDVDINFKKVFEKLGIPHSLDENNRVIITGEDAKSLLFTLGFYNSEKKSVDFTKECCILRNLTEISGIQIKDKAGTFVGARMGRPEKAKQRKVVGSPHVLFPVGAEGGRLKTFQAALDAGYVEAEFMLNHCSSCNHDTIYSHCEKCGKEVEERYYCIRCESEKTEKECEEHGINHRYSKRKIKIKDYYDDALKKLKLKNYPDIVKGVKEVKNEKKVVEHLAKGILRAKHNLFVNKDGTTRFDMTELPITHFKPMEIGTSVERLKELGYEKDYLGNNLFDDNQIIEILPHDMILPAGDDALDEQADNVLFRVGKLVDDLLANLYNEKPYYNFTRKEDVVGSYVVGLAPHISAGTVGRVIGFSQTQGLLAHPLMHAAMRRDCDGDEAAVILLMDALLNFSRSYLPNTRGARTMDAPLVLSSRIIPTEVDDMVHGIDIVSKYKLDIYLAAEKMKKPWDIEVLQVKNVLNSPDQYENYGFTHDVTNINLGVNCSAYKSLPSMEEKLVGQMKIAEKIRAVDERNVAELVIEKHFLKDTKGNLRKFSTQQFRCVKCNKKYRRPPLAGKCSCAGKLIFTVSEGSVIKYLYPSIELSRRYNVKKYLKQTLELLKLRVDEVFGKKNKENEDLQRWFS